MLMYDVRYADSPEKAVLDFFESVYKARAKKANWKDPMTEFNIKIKRD